MDQFGILEHGSDRLGTLCTEVVATEPEQSGCEGRHVTSFQGGLNTSGRCDVDGSPEALQLGLRQHLSQFDHARHVPRVGRPGKLV